MRAVTGVLRMVLLWLILLRAVVTGVLGMTKVTGFLRMVLLRTVTGFEDDLIMDDPIEGGGMLEVVDSWN
jgi:hypothetical protein